VGIRNGKSYYYRKERVGGRIRSIYCEAGEKGRLAEAEDNLSRSTSDVPELRHVKKEVLDSPVGTPKKETSPEIRIDKKERAQIDRLTQPKEGCVAKIILR
jgi:hypothetical protein